MGRYWVDANVFIWGNREPYPLPGARSYWNWFESQIDSGKIITHWKCLREVTDGEKRDDPELIVQWVKTRKNKLTAPADTPQISGLVGEMCEHCYETFGTAKTVEFTKGGDLWLIASAKLDNGKVVTQESTKKQLRIPAICEKFEVAYVSMFTMNHELKMNLAS
jgi:Domain of unknown function (DUF4411)